MKKLYLIGGTMGVGKTTVSQLLSHKVLPKCVFLDGDWCWDATPFTVTEETKAMVMDNICHMLSNFIKCSAYENVVFCWVMHEESIIDSILSRLPTEGVDVKAVSLTVSPENLKLRLTGDVESGKRTSDVIERSIARLPLYDKLNTVKISTDGKTPFEIATEISKL